MKNFSTPEEAEAAFYRAFEEADWRAMMEVWDDSHEVVCVHPQGPRLAGRSAIEASWRAILGNQMRLRFNVTDRAQFAEGPLAVHIVHENIFLPGDMAPQPPIIATNVYRKTNAGWRMVLHHASPTPVPAAPKQRRASVH